MLKVSIRDVVGESDQPHEAEYPLNQLILKNQVRLDFIIKGPIPLSLTCQLSATY